MSLYCGLATRNRMRKGKICISLVLFFSFFAGLHCAGKVPVVAVQPLGRIDANIVKRVTEGITRVYKVRLIVLPGVDLPSSAWYPKGARYRADKLLSFLNGKAYKDFDKVIGLTACDISTTKGAIYDWGIFGLGLILGRPCVVSTFRLKRGASAQLFSSRLIKVVNHELGHTFGIPHCPSNNCIMEDAEGTIRTVDRETGSFCKICRAYLKMRGVCNICD
jgi:archaemetzincin